MSVDEAISATVAGAAAAAAAAVVDLTCSDGEETPVTPIAKGGGDLHVFSPYLKKIRQKPKPSSLKLQAIKAEEEERKVLHDKPKVVTPRDKKKRARKEGKFGVGYTFRKQFSGGWYTGKVIEIRRGAARGRDRRCKYSDGDVEDLSVRDLDKLPEVHGDVDGAAQHGSAKDPPEPYAPAPPSSREGGVQQQPGQQQHASNDSDDDVSLGNSDEDGNTCCDKHDASSGDKRHSSPGSTEIPGEDDKQVLSDDDKSLFSNESDELPCEENNENSSDDDKSLVSSPGSTKLPGEDKKQDSSDDDKSLFSNESDELPCEENNENSSDDDKSLFSHTNHENELPDGEGNSHRDGVREDLANEFTAERDWYAPDPPSKYKVKRISGWRPSTLAEFETPYVIRKEPDPNYLAVIFKERIRVYETLKVYGPPRAEIKDYRTRYQLIYCDYIKGGNGKKSSSEDGTGRPRFKSHYLAVSGPGLDRIDLESALSGIANFEKLCYDSGPQKVASYLKLLVNNACTSPSKKWPLIHRLPSDMFEVIEDVDECYQGCGFAPLEVFYELLDIDTIKSGRKVAIQVRLFAPSSFGIAKGVLFPKQGIKKIQVPTSMIKVDGCGSGTPMHDDVIIVIIMTFPSEKNYDMERLINGESLRESNKDGLRVKNDDIPYIKQVLYAKGVEHSLLEEYFSDFNSGVGRYNHASLVAVTDPTGSLPEGHVFLTGLGHRLPQNVFLTRSPCTEGADGKVVRVACANDMPSDDYNFLASKNFGAVVFSIKGKPLPPQINNSDCDGDRMAAFWDEKLVDSMLKNDKSTSDLHFCSDDMIREQTEFDYEGYSAKVIGIDECSPDTYRVQLSKGARVDNTISLTRDEILKGKEELIDVLNHRPTKVNKRPHIEFELKWKSTTQDTLGPIVSISWKSLNEIHSMFSSSMDVTVEPPRPLLEYYQENKKDLLEVVGKSHFKWLIKHLDTLPVAELEEVVGHRITEKGLEVCCQYDDGEAIWEKLEDVKNDAKFEVGKYWYSRKEELSGLHDWDDMRGFWLGEVAEFLVTRSTGFDSIRCELNGKFKKACDAHDPNHKTPRMWGRAFKQSIDIEKHGGKVELPLSFYEQVSKNNRAYIKII